MSLFQGRLNAHPNGEPFTASVLVEDGRARIWSGHRRIGVWEVDALRCERVGVFKFHLILDGVTHVFVPDDPAGFADAVGAVVDLRPTSRFGLGERVKAAKEALAVERSASLD